MAAAPPVLSTNRHAASTFGPIEPAAYRRVRNALAATTLMALMLHVAYPLAPPRMMPGFVDTMARFGPEIYESGRIASAANQIAAMPSLHFAWALMVAWAIVMTVRHPMCWVVLAHPVLMLLAIVATANHWWVDSAVAGALVLVATRVEAARLPVPLSEPPPLPPRVALNLR